MIFLFAVCWALLTAGAALECEVCYTLDSNICQGHYKRCDSIHSHCMVTLTETSVGDLRSAVLEKSCGSIYDCSHPASLTAGEYRVRVTTTCCETDYCNNGTINWKPPNATKNGVKCASCFSKNFGPCDSRATVNCTGEENQCVQFAVTKSGGAGLNVAGCASESMRRSQGKAAFRGTSLFVTGFRYSNGGGSVHHGPFLPALTVLFLMKIL
ncbi:phospholipase A2 inhibitor and Ly6/PLAUR domain-containing protein-like isoform X1 [Ascaphus truei]|uniref:phospholipase A2 inhibitor and Ly6/PLAUR domain-containing protein-like isoform X1 n=1 Tax=Ascaphus truei TaxID=8439 RepID=UPI003F5A820C